MARFEIHCYPCLVYASVYRRPVSWPRIISVRRRLVQTSPAARCTAVPPPVSRRGRWERDACIGPVILLLVDPRPASCKLILRGSCEVEPKNWHPAGAKASDSYVDFRMGVAACRAQEMCADRKERLEALEGRYHYLISRHGIPRTSYTIIQILPPIPCNYAVLGGGPGNSQ